MSIWKLIFYRLKIAAAGLTRGPVARRIARGLALATLGTLMVLLVMGTYVVFTALASLGDAGATAAAVVVLLAFNAVLVLALVFDILTTTGIFFLSSDLSLLMAAPIPTYKVFALKYLEAMVAASFVALLVGIPIFMGYGLAFHAPVLFYVALVVVTAVFITIPISVGTICGMVVSRFVPAARVREALAVLSGAIGLGLWIALQVFKPTLAGPEQIQDFGTQMQALARGTAGGLLGALPSRFPADILTSLADGQVQRRLCRPSRGSWPYPG